MIPRTLPAALLAGCLLLPVPAHSTDPLPRHDPARHAVDAEALEAGLDAFAAIDGALAMVVVRDGAVVGERYTDGNPAALRYDWSVTKSVTSLLVGTAIGHGLLSGTGARIGDVLPPDYRPEVPAKAAITVGHLLTMTSGLEWDEEADVVLWFHAPDPLADILNRPLQSWPGTEFVYDTAACHILSGVLGWVTGMDEAEWARRTLFAPLGITDWRWDRDPQGRAFGGHGLALRTDDAAKLGVLALSGGRWHGRAVVPEAWIARSTTVRIPLGARFGPLERIDYGYLWWTDRSLAHPVFTAWGWAGQFVFCVPVLELVVAANCAPDRPTWEEANRVEAAVLDVIVHRIVPAARPRRHGPRRPGGRTGRPRAHGLR